MFYIQVFEYKKLNTKAKDLWSRDLELEADFVRKKREEQDNKSQKNKC